MKKLSAILAILVLFQVILLAQEEAVNNRLNWDFNLSIGKSFVKPSTFFSPELTDIFEFTRIINNHLKIGFCSSMARFQGNKSFSLPYVYKVNIGEISPVILYDLNRIITIGGGPALYYLGFSSTFNKIGFIIKSNLKYPKTSRLFAQIDFQYRYVGKIDKITYYDYSHHSLFTSYNINSSHFYVGIGIGLRI